MGKMIDLTGQKFGRLTVLGPAPTPEGKKTIGQHWRCLCECRKEVVVRGDNLRSRRTKSCGCLKKQSKHNKIGTRLYRIYNAMKTRCYNKNAKAFNNYGARGIKICQNWLNKENGFMNFYNWAMSHGYSDDLSIDRIDVNGDYSELNCRWETSTNQNRNRRRIRFNKYKGIYRKQSGKYEAYDRKAKYLGTFATIEEAVEARQKAERELYPENKN